MGTRVVAVALLLPPVALLAGACGGERLTIRPAPARQVDYGAPIRDVAYATDPDDAAPAPARDVEPATEAELPPPCIDLDGDGYGRDCGKGPDCDDANPHFGEECPACGPGEITRGCPCPSGVPAVSCYEGPPETRGAGECRDGRRYCVNGFWSHCSEQTTPAPDTCNHRDDDCDGATDEEAVSTCGACTPDTDCLNAGPGSGSAFFPNPSKNSRNVALDKEGNVRLTTKSGSGTSAKAARFIWIANSPENTVSRLDTTTGWEVARYRVCNDPSRTAVDLYGNGVITCRGDGRVGKVAIFEEDCRDRNGDDQIQTSRDADGDHVITPGEMVADDECVLWVVQPDANTQDGCGAEGGGCARAAGVDKDNHVWVGFWNSMKVMRLDGETGGVLATHAVSRRPYGLAIDSAQTVWVTSRHPCGVMRVDPGAGQTGDWEDPAGNCFYGIAVDPWDKVWLANYDGRGMNRFDPATTTFTHWFPTPGSYPRGVAVAATWDPATGAATGARVYAGDCPSESGASLIPVIDAKSMTALPSISLGFNGCPVGVAVDADGFLWTVNQGSSNATKVDLSSGAPVGTYPVGPSPYTYSDMTGYALRNFTLIEGWYRHVLTSDLPGPVQWLSLWVLADVPEGAWIKARVRAADDGGAIEGAQWTPKIGPFPPAQWPADLAPYGVTGRVLEIELLLHSEVAKAGPIVKGFKAYGKQVP
ncbi:MAG: hypothetical protein FJ087_10950 [Deltaproteobacteria bacterium]|nr:hypothetical protein [Deltaproteobacteria bacterium]